MKKKGFTLIELLAVIVLLAIITVIAVPKILDVIEKSRRTAWGESAGLMAKAAELKYSEGNLTNTESDETTYEFENGDFKSKSPTLTFKGDKPYSGVIKQIKGKTTLALISKNKKWCAIKNTGERIAKVYKIGSEIKEEDCKIGYTGSSDDDKPEVYTCPNISTYPGENLTSSDTKGYEFSADKTTITGYTGETGENVDLIIPKSIDGTIIKSISSSILSGKTFNSITISPNIASIGQGVLEGVTVNRLNLDYATGLTSLSLLGIKSNDVVIACSNKLTTIHDSMDSNIANLEIKNLDNLITISDFTRATITNMTLDNIPITSLNMSGVNSSSFETLTLKKLSKLETIEANSFKNTSLTSLTLNNNNVPELKTIGANAFATSTDAANKITSLTLSNLSNLTTIGEGAFSNQGISALTIKGLSNLKTINSRAFEQNKISSISFDEMPNVTTIGNNAFLSNPLTNLDFKAAKKLTSIGESAFYSTKTFNTIDFSELTQAISGTLVATKGSVKTLNFSKTGTADDIDMTTFIQNNINAFDSIEEINLENSGIKSLSLSARGINKIILNGCNSLTSLTSSGNKIKSLDLRNLGALNQINLTDESNLETLKVSVSNDLASITCNKFTKLTKINTIGLNNLNTLFMPSCQNLTTVGISSGVLTIPPTDNNKPPLLITSGANLTCVQIDGDKTRINETNFNQYFPGASTSVIKSSCNSD